MGGAKLKGAGAGKGVGAGGAETGVGGSAAKRLTILCVEAVAGGARALCVGGSCCMPLISAMADCCDAAVAAKMLLTGPPAAAAAAAALFLAVMRGEDRFAIAAPAPLRLSLRSLSIASRSAVFAFSPSMLERRARRSMVPFDGGFKPPHAALCRYLTPWNCKLLSKAIEKLCLLLIRIGAEQTLARLVGKKKRFWESRRPAGEEQLGAAVDQ